MRPETSARTSLALGLPWVPAQSRPWGWAGLAVGPRLAGGLAYFGLALVGCWFDLAWLAYLLILAWLYLALLGFVWLGWLTGSLGLWRTRSQRRSPPGADLRSKECPRS